MASFTIFASNQNSRNGQQASIARGEQLFNTQTLTISNVPGLMTGGGSIMGTRTTATPRARGLALTPLFDVAV
jgi:hypothetical protein